MSKISDFANEVKAKFTEIGTSLSGVSTDVQALKDKITDLEGRLGQLDPADQALLDEIKADVNGLADRTKALDDATPPNTPAPTPDGGTGDNNPGEPTQPTVPPEPPAEPTPTEDRTGL